MTEQQRYEVLRRLPEFEVRRYPAHLVAAVPAQVAAARTFSGRWSEGIYRQQLAKLRTDVAEAGLEISGPARFARFNPPWTPWFLRRNEVVLPVRADAE